MYRSVVPPPAAPATHRRPGRPPSNLLKVTVTVRIPADVDSFLTTYASEQGLFKGDVIADAVIARFRLRQKDIPATLSADGSAP
jgi:hypothetical protein